MKIVKCNPLCLLFLGTRSSLDAGCQRCLEILALEIHERDLVINNEHDARDTQVSSLLEDVYIGKEES